jgi:leucyl-tRNA synthetase
MQRNWIGRSVGVSLRFEVADGHSAGQHIEVFTTRPETLFGVTYVVVAPEHPLALLLATDEQRELVTTYIDSASRKNDLERTELAKEKSGIWTGSFVRNPASGKLVPVWVADYVLGGYGTGAVMAVPAHDARDFDFAVRFGLPIVPVVRDASNATRSDALPFTSDGVIVSSSDPSSIDLNGKYSTVFYVLSREWRTDDCNFHQTTST